MTQEDLYVKDVKVWKEFGNLLRKKKGRQRFEPGTSLTSVRVIKQGLIFMYFRAFSDFTCAVSENSNGKTKFNPEYFEVPLEHVVSREFYSRKG